MLKVIDKVMRQDGAVFLRIENTDAHHSFWIRFQ